MKFRLYPTAQQERVLNQHCDAARYVWNLAVEQQHYRKRGESVPGWAQQCRQLTEARAACDWFAAWNVDVCQQALRDFQHARARMFDSGFGNPTWRKKFQNEGFRVIGGARVPSFSPDGSPELNRTGKQVMGRRVAVGKLNRKWAQVKLPGAGWVRFRLTVRHVPDAKSCRVTWKNGQWHVAFAIQPEPVDKPGNGKTAGIDRGVAVTAALHDGQTLNCPQPSTKERAKRRKHERRAARAPKRSQAKADEYAAVATLKARAANVRKDWCEKTSTMLACSFDQVRFEKLDIRTMTRSAKGTVEAPGSNVRAKAGLNRSILAQGWGCCGPAPSTKHQGGSPMCPPRTPVCVAAAAGGSRRTRARAKPSSFACPAVSPATPTPTQPSTSRPGRPEGRQPARVRAPVNRNPHSGLWNHHPSGQRGSQEHEYAVVWDEVALPDGKVIVPGVISHATPIVEHPRLVAQRLVRFAERVGRANVLAGTDCGLGGRVHPEIAWAKLRSLSEGARLASEQLWAAG